MVQGGWMLEVHYGYFSYKMKVFLWGEKKCDGKFLSGGEVQEGKLNKLSKEKSSFKLLSVKLLKGEKIGSLGLGGLMNFEHEGTDGVIVV